MTIGGYLQCYTLRFELTKIYKAPVFTTHTLKSELTCTEGLEIPNYEFKTFSQLDHDIQWETKEK